MIEDLFRRVDLDLLYPRFRAVALSVIEQCRSQGHYYVAQHGFRSYELQLQMRHDYLNGKGGRASPAGFSAHQYGLAIDFVSDKAPEVPGLQPDWSDPAYDALGKEAQAAGLVWGVGFGDRPHVQWPGFVNATQLHPLLDVWRGTPDPEDHPRLAAVWQYVAEHSPGPMPVYP